MNTIVKNVGDVFVIKLMGHLNYESADAFKANCLNELGNKRIVFNLSGLSFVGSVGITPFLEAIEEITQLRPGQMKLCNVSTEFKRIFEASKALGLEIYENEDGAVRSFYLQTQMPQMQFVSNQQVSSSQQQAINSVPNFGLNNSIEEE